jgi:glutathione reductase (NADPH)
MEHLRPSSKTTERRTLLGAVAHKSQDRNVALTWRQTLGTSVPSAIAGKGDPLNGNSQKPNYLGIPTVVFAIPPLASAGLSEAEARRQNLRFKVNHETTSSWYSSHRIGETHSGFKVLVEEGTERILGAHVLGEEAGELINLFAVAIRNGIRASDLKQTLFAYPTHGSNLPYML